MTPEFVRAQLLREHGRHEEAVSMLTGHLSRHPEDSHAYIEMALNRARIPGAKTLALEDAKKASGLTPDDPFPLALQARILADLNREKEALPLVERAIAMDPEQPFFWNTRALALCGLSRWKEAEEAARQALALDSDDETASNLLSHALRLQNKLAESEEETRRRLARDPENAFSFANAGWAALQRRQVGEAENLFREALRLDPEMDHARAGLKESYRARSAFYRLFLRWAFFMQRFSQKHQLLIILGIIFGFRILRALAENVHPLLIIPLALVYYLFLFGTWLAGGLANFLLLKDPVARLSLDRGEKTEGLVVGLFFFGGLLALLGGLAAGMIPVALLGGALLVAAIPATMIFTNPSPKGRLVFAACALAILGLGGKVAAALAANPGQDIDDSGAGGAFSLALLLAVAVTWLGSVPSLRQVKPS